MTYGSSTASPAACVARTVSCVARTFSLVALAIARVSKATSAATVQGTFANGRGSINMTFHATGPVIHPKGCDGSGQRGRRGVLRGTYVLHADRLGKVTQKSFRATLWSHYNPPTNPPCSHPAYELSSRGEVVDVTTARATGRVSEAISVSKGREAKWSIAYSYLVMGLPGSDYKVGFRLSSAKVTGAGGISGTAVYSGDKAAHSSFGKLSGNLEATMAAIGRLRPFAKHSLHASQYWSVYRTG